MNRCLSTRACHAWYCSLLWVALASLPWASPPATINLQGSLAGNVGPVTGTHTFQIEFYPQAVGGAPLQQVTGTLNISTDGRYSLAIMPNAALLAAPEVWYQLAVDTDDNGIDTNDVFPQRVRIHSVPFALLAQDSEQLGGMASSQYATAADLATGLAGKAALDHEHGDQYWKVGGNVVGASEPQPLGTLDDNPLQLYAGGVPVLQLIPAATTPNLVAGYFANSASEGIRAAVVAGGGDPELGINQAAGDFAVVGGGVGNLSGNIATTVAGGRVNLATGDHATVAGGYANRATGGSAAVGGGLQNYARGNLSTIGGGAFNEAGGARVIVSYIGIGYPRPIFGDVPGFVGGGRSNKALGAGSVVAGGFLNTASGDYSFAAGRRAKALRRGSFVWADATDEDFNDEGEDTFNVRANRGMNVYTENYYGARFRNSAGGSAGYFSGKTGTGVGGTSALVVINDGTGAALYASNLNLGPAAQFSGNVHVFGSLSKGGGSFKIDHPLDPENKYFSHSFVESPDMMNIYNGNVILDASGEATVELPGWFGALNRDFRYQLTCIGGFAPVHVAEEITENRFKIAGGTAGLKVSWQVTGIRQDAYANAHRVAVEESKPPEEQGRYLHPEAFGKPASMGMAAFHDELAAH